MSGANVCVLALNGRRQTVKCTPNTTILQILEEVCRKQDLKPEEYDLKHHNKVLDTTTTFRFSGLPNNAQLELVEAVKLRFETDITVAVNLENGNRLMGTFKPSDTLLNILHNLCPESVTHDKHPVIIYTRREIYGKELENVTLRSLGLTSGRAMIRLIHRSPDELKTQANVSAPLPAKPVEEKPYQRKLKRIPSPPRSEEKKENLSMPQTQQKNTNVDILKLAREKRKSTDASQKEEKRKSVEKKAIKEVLKRPACECKMDESMEVDCCGKCQERCTNISDKKDEDEFVFLGERNAMLFSLETAHNVPSEDLPDDFFDLTIDDAKKILRDVKRQRSRLENKALLTSNLRQLEENKKQLRQLNKYKKAIIRIQFPDRTVLQGTFSPVDTIRDVIEFIREYLEDKSLKFYVYSTPPKCILEETQRLIELGFVPGAMIHFGTSKLSKEIHFLRRDLRGKFTSSSLASLAASKMRKENTRTCAGRQEEEEDPDLDEYVPKDANNEASTSTGITHENYERKVVNTSVPPKWFKP